MRMSLRTKLMLITGIVVLVSVEGIFLYMSKVHEDSIKDQLREQAKSIAEQVLVVRLWSAMHRESITPVPAELTYEISELSNKIYDYRIRLITFKPRDPENYPKDNFEERALRSFMSNSKEYYELNSEYYQYAVPLKVEEPCLKCHIDQGYREGDLRGALVVEIPSKKVIMGLAYTKIKLIIYGLIISMITMGIIWISAETLVLSPLNRIKKAAESLAKRDYSARADVESKDEIGELARTFNQMVEELREKETQVIQSEKLASIGKLAAGLAHEINNPLANIILYSQMFSEEVKDEETKNVLKIIEEEAKHASRILQSLLEFSRKEGGEEQYVDINEVVKKVLNIVKPQLKYNKIKVRLEMQKLPKLRANASQIMTAIMNIVSNAIDAMEGGGILSITTKRERDGIAVEIADTGVGIPKENLDKIFDPFFTTKEPGKGTGLGLYIAYNIVKKYGGDIKVESEVGKGTKFTLYFKGVSHGGSSDSGR